MNNSLTPEARDALLALLRERFAKNMYRHASIQWSVVEERLLGQPQKLWSISQMESTGGEPDVMVYKGEYIYIDCVAQTPQGRRSLCYDRAALDGRKENKPQGNVVEMAEQMGVTLLDEEAYRALQALSPVDTKTSSWLSTPDDVRALGGALFGDYRYGRVFVYHNGAESYYGVRAFRVMVRL
ncbi:MAG: hypothetical protein KU37_08685 [Sulfuricurvum sp. PC08-66]|nr:MAG: hypothetical protein KU37_08685 [Sulfuricurvum sp. PC08-66]